MNKVIKKTAYRIYPTDLSEVISESNVRYLGEVMAICTMKSLSKYLTGPEFDRLFKGLLRDIKSFGNSSYALSDGYDFVQTAICFLIEHYGRTLNDILGIDKKGKPITVKFACLKAVSSYINEKFRRNSKSVCIDEIRDIETPPFEHLTDSEQAVDADFIGVDETIETMGLTDRQRDALLYRMDGKSYSETGQLLSITKWSAFYIIEKIRKIYINIFSEPKLRK